MAGTAGAVFLHICHGMTFVPAVRSEKSIVAVAAAVHLKVPGVGKPGILCKEYLLYRMAAAAVLCN